MSYQLHVFYDNAPKKVYFSHGTIEEAADLASMLKTYPHVVDIILEKEYE